MAWWQFGKYEEVDFSKLSSFLVNLHTGHYANLKYSSIRITHYLHLFDCYILLTEEIIGSLKKTTDHMVPNSFFLIFYLLFCFQKAPTKFDNNNFLTEIGIWNYFKILNLSTFFTSFCTYVQKWIHIQQKRISIFVKNYTFSLFISYLILISYNHIKVNVSVYNNYA